MTKTERDAARYRWLRDKSLNQAYKLPQPAVFRCDNECKVIGQPIDGTRLDKYIDAAMMAETADVEPEGRVP